MSAADMQTDKLVRMANQIATFFESQPGDGAASISDHIHSFWNPVMRRRIYAYLDAGGQGLQPLAHEALTQLRLADPAARQSSD